MKGRTDEGKSTFVTYYQEFFNGVPLHVLITNDGQKYLLGTEMSLLLRRETYNVYRSLKVKQVEPERASIDEVHFLTSQKLISSGTHSVTLVPYEPGKQYIDESLSKSTSSGAPRSNKQKKQEPKVESLPLLQPLSLLLQQQQERELSPYANVLNHLRSSSSSSSSFSPSPEPMMSLQLPPLQLPSSISPPFSSPASPLSPSSFASSSPSPRSAVSRTDGGPRPRYSLQDLLAEVESPSFGLEPRSRRKGNRVPMRALRKSTSPHDFQ